MSMFLINSLSIKHLDPDVPTFFGPLSAGIYGTVGFSDFSKHNRFKRGEKKNLLFPIGKNILHSSDLYLF